MLLVECWLDVHHNGTIVVDKESSPHLSVEEGDEYVVFIRNGQVIFAKKSTLPDES